MGKFQSTDIPCGNNCRIGVALASMQGGGIQKAAMRLIAEFLRLGIPTSLIVVNSNGPIREETPVDCDLIDLDVQRTRRALRKLISTLNLYKPDVIISAQTHLNVLLVIARFFSGYPRTLVVVEHITFNEKITLKGKLAERMRPLMIRLFYPFADKVVAVSPASANSIYHYAKLKKKVDVIWNGLDLDEIQESANQPVSHPWVGKRDFKLLVGIGRLTPQKNFSELLKAFANLDEIENYRLLILGEGPDGNQLRSLTIELGLQDHIDFLGFVENPYPFLAQADLVVLSSKWEGFANVVIESLACGTPIVSTDCPGGPKDILEDKPFAKIVPLGEPKAMAIAIQDILSADIDETEITRFAQQFTIQNTAQHYLDLITVSQD